MVTFNSKTYSKRLLHLISWSHWFTFFNIIAAIALSSFYLFSEVAPETFLGQVYLVVTWVSHMGFLTFMSFVLILFPLILLIPHTKFIRSSASVIYTIGLLLLLLDGFIYSRLGYHLNASSSEQIIALITHQIDQNQRGFWFVSLVLCLVILTFELVISNYAWKHLRQLQKTTFAKPVISVFVSAFFISHLTHIWADANLDYDILRQDTVLPLSYPSTAKTLLTKYGMFNREDYIERKTSPLSFTDNVPPYPAFNGQCASSTEVERSVFLVVTKAQLTKTQVDQFARRAQSSSIKFNSHIDTALNGDAWFNLFYSLPTIYQSEILAQNTSPLLFQAINAASLDTSYTLIGENTSLESSIESSWRDQLFSRKSTLKDISSLIFADKLNSFNKGLHLIYFNDEDPYQFQLFMDALLLAQQQRNVQDFIWVSSIGNNKPLTSLSIKPAMLIAPTSKRSKEIDVLTSHMDLQPTLMKRWLDCDIAPQTYSNGVDMAKVKSDRVIANTMENGIMVFNKDKSVFIDQNGNFQSYSRQLEAPITVSSDFPLMIDGVHFIKQFSKHNQTEQ